MLHDLVNSSAKMFSNLLIPFSFPSLLLRSKEIYLLWVPSNLIPHQLSDMLHDCTSLTLF